MNIIKILLLLLLSIVFFSCSERKQDSGLIKADLSKLTKDFDKVVVYKWGYEFLGDTIKISDTIDAKEGKFEYRFKTKEPKITSFSLLKNNKRVGKLSFGDKTSKKQNFWADIYIGNENAIINPICEYPTKANNTIKLYRVNIVGSKEADIRMRTFYEDHISSGSIKANPDCYAILHQLFAIKEKYSVEQLKKLSLMFSDELKKSVSYAIIQRYINNREELEKYGYTHNFNWVDLNGKNYTFGQVKKGKPMTLLIFWASWCGPCRNEIPELKQFYNEYKDKVSMVSLSIDNKYANWKMAVEKENMPWLNLSGLPNNPSGIKEKFNINTVPNLILLDKNGKVLINGFNNLSEVKKIIISK